MLVILTEQLRLMNILAADKSIKYIAFYTTDTVNKKHTFDIDSRDMDSRKCDKLARVSAKELVKTTDTIYRSLIELVRIDPKSDRIYSDGSGKTFLVTDVHIY